MNFIELLNAMEAIILSDASEDSPQDLESDLSPDLEDLLIDQTVLQGEDDQESSS